MRSCFGRLTVFAACALTVLLGGLAPRAVAQDAPGRFEAPVPPDGRPNPYQLAPEAAAKAWRAGLVDALVYPAGLPALAIPYRPVDSAFDRLAEQPALRAALERIGALPFGASWPEVWDHLGLVSYAGTSGAAPYEVPRPPEALPALGAARVTDRNGAEVVTLSCAACHARNLFGRAVIGLHNDRIRLFSLVEAGKKVELLPDAALVFGLGANAAEKAAFDDLKDQLHYVGVRPPPILGLDSAICAIALSLARRAPDDMATRLPFLWSVPRPTPLATEPCDSKPTEWWQVKYKNRTLSDASLVGNPLLHVLLFMTILEGGDLGDLETWVEEHEPTVIDLSTAVFATEPPRWTDFFPASSIDLPLAREGAAVFGRLCASCHGSYDKAWDDPTVHDPVARLATTHVRYPSETVALNVGTDPARANATQDVAAGLNGLRFTQEHGLTVTPHPASYVAPPLVGVWSSWPYLHNGSVPTLCELLKPASERLAKFAVGPSESAERDFDQACVGLPTGARTPAAWHQTGQEVDTSRPGLANTGHDEGIITAAGAPLLTDHERQALLEYLKVL